MTGFMGCVGMIMGVVMIMVVVLMVVVIMIVVVMMAHGKTPLICRALTVVVRREIREADFTHNWL